ncbi:DUF4359 domain-containing protein [Neobacillus vireti]|uniref:DUF4359 domain-containing protein n=1 Tax=Neobacillus vireti TaxID=220686 RepID=UPI0030003DD2
MKRFASIIFLAVLIFVMSFTNPGRAAYVDWINHKTMDESSNILQKGILSFAGKSIFDAGTTQSDYFIFSIYETDFTKVGMGKVKSIGIFNKFIPFSSTQEQK